MSGVLCSVKHPGHTSRLFIGTQLHVYSCQISKAAKIVISIIILVHVVLHPHGIAPTFLKLDSWSPGAGFIPIITTNVLNKIKKGKL